MPDAVNVTCATHGPMRYRDPLMWWDCVGFDGIDGCEVILADEEVHKIVYGRPIELGEPRSVGKRSPKRWTVSRRTDDLLRTTIDILVE